MNDVVVYSYGLIHASVCAKASLTREEVEKGASLSHPTGLDHGWTISSDPTFADGSPIPSPCNTDEARLHWLLDC